MENNGGGFAALFAIPGAQFRHETETTFIRAAGCSSRR